MASVSDYVQLMKLRIDSLLLLVAAAGYIATSGVAVDAWRFGLLMVAGFLGAAGASATNHYLDRDLDSVMHRTRSRPLPQHRIEPPVPALAYRSREDYRRALLPMLPAVWGDRTSALAIAGSTAIVAVASIAFFFTAAFDAIYLAVATVSGVVLLGLTAKFIAHPSPETAWAGYKFSGIYLALVLFGMMADALLRIPL